MKTKVTAKDVAKPVVVLFLICLIVSLMLAFTNELTKNKIVEINQQNEQASQQQVLPGADSFETKTSQGVTYSVGKKGGAVTGYVFTTTSKSYGGDVKVMTGISKDGKVTGVNLLETSDTPGLGLNAQDASFRDQYKQKVPDSGQFEVNKSGKTGDGQIAALTGATITSRAVTDAVNQAVKTFNTVKGGA
ncbi:MULTISPECIES: RnfABCDGE type electron transport complex subunit G [Caproicibacterium]|uniref:Ion-translocating oxidoreductase complex subunit G n=1 Tax=Caproicibacterium argilliputei TaxID=3030016 RepID=A0AA97H1M2_9FIRM|nr:RnfABCDGE type electron transport complex subunit G [Caproicibacterium argilliputei]WOC31457.1 RnfABCDGE type electron transport complex subunit G [Caproicibacterium argilliputei]